MCRIIYIGGMNGKKLSKKTIKLAEAYAITAWNIGNDDGMFVETDNGVVRTLDINEAIGFIRKSETRFINMHARAGTHGSVAKQNVHGWKLKGYRVSHNGIFAGYGRSNYMHLPFDKDGSDKDITDSKAYAMEVLEKSAKPIDVAKKLKKMQNGNFMVFSNKNKSIIASTKTGKFILRKDENGQLFYTFLSVADIDKIAYDLDYYSSSENYDVGLWKFKKIVTEHISFEDFEVIVNQNFEDKVIILDKERGVESEEKIKVGYGYAYNANRNLNRGYANTGQVNTGQENIGFNGYIDGYDDYL